MIFPNRSNKKEGGVQENHTNLVTPRYIEAPLENPLLFLQSKEIFCHHDYHIITGSFFPHNCSLFDVYTFLSAQRILACSCSSFLRVQHGNFQSAKANQKRVGFQGTKDSNEAKTVSKNEIYRKIYMRGRSPVLKSREIIGSCSFLFHVVTP